MHTSVAPDFCSLDDRRGPEDGCGALPNTTSQHFYAVSLPASTAAPLYAGLQGAAAGATLWPMVLEKAYAKMHFSWDTIDGGWAREALVDLTGGLETSYDLHNKEKNMTFKQFARDVTDKRTVMGCSVGTHVGSEGGGLVMRRLTAFAEKLGVRFTYEANVGNLEFLRQSISAFTYFG